MEATSSSSGCQLLEHVLAAEAVSAGKPAAPVPPCGRTSSRLLIPVPRPGLASKGTAVALDRSGLRRAYSPRIAEIRRVLHRWLVALGDA